MLFLMNQNFSYDLYDCSLHKGNKMNRIIKLEAFNRGLRNAIVAQFKEIAQFLKLKTSQLLKWFMQHTMDRQIAIIISIYTVATLLFGTLQWITILCFVIAWGFVYREDYTKPAIMWFCKETKPIRRRFTIWVCKILFSGYGFPISMIGWGVVCFSLFGIFLYVDKNVAGMFGMAGFSGIIFGTFFYAVEKYNENCKIKVTQDKHTAKN